MRIGWREDIQQVISPEGRDRPTPGGRRKATEREMLTAAEMCDTEYVLLSLGEDGLDVQTTSQDGDHLALIAAGTNNIDLLEYVLQRLPHLAWQPNKAGLTALHVAAMQGFEDALMVLIKQNIPMGLDLKLVEAGAPEDAEDIALDLIEGGNASTSFSFGKGIQSDLTSAYDAAGGVVTPLEAAGRCGRVQACRLLMENGAQPKYIVDKTIRRICRRLRALMRQEAVTSAACSGYTGVAPTAVYVCPASTAS